MRIQKPIVAFAAALALWAWSNDEAYAPPGPPMPMGGGPPRIPMGGGGPPRPVMGPMGGGGLPRGVSAPGGIGGLPRPPGGIPGGGAAGLAGLQHPPGGMAGLQHPSSGIAGPQQLSTFAGLRNPSGGAGGQGRPAGLGGLASLAKSGVLAKNSSTPNVSQHALSEQANRVRNSYNHRDCFRENWWGRHQGAWQARRWADAAVAYYGTANWAAYYGYCGYDYSSEPIYYNYGSYVVYESTNVYVNGEAIATQQQYAEQAMTIADNGKTTRVAQDEEWLSLGVFSVVQGEQATGNDLFQLAVNKSGVIRGSYYNALADTTVPIYGSVDKNTQRAAWTVGNRKEPVFEAGIANLTTSETTMVVHFSEERTQQLILVRIDPSAESK